MTWITGINGHCLNLLYRSRRNRQCSNNGTSVSLLSSQQSHPSGGNFLSSTASGSSETGTICDVHSLMSPVILIILMVVSAQSAILTFITQLIVLPSFILILNYSLPRIRLTNLFISWTVSSFILIVSVFEFEVVPYLEILLYENIIFVSLTTIALITAIIIRKRSQSMSPIDQYHDPLYNGHNYCSFLKCMINSKNSNLFLTGLIVTMVVLVYGSQLMTTTICHPYLAYGTVLIPDDCTDVYSDFT